MKYLIVLGIISIIQSERVGIALGRNRKLVFVNLCNDVIQRIIVSVFREDVRPDKFLTAQCFFSTTQSANPTIRAKRRAAWFLYV